MELKSYFDKFLSNIEPTANQKAEASTGHKTLRSRLEQDDDYKKCFRDSFISGSYGRDTAIRPINDVDIIIITNHTDALKPDTALSILERALKKYYANVKRQGRSVRVALSYITMDIVPTITTDGLDNFLKIPDRELQKWDLTHPRKHLQLATEINTKRNQLYKPFVKALKQWRDYRMEDAWKPKSFLLECLAYDYAIQNSILSIPSAIKDFFWFTHNKYDAHRKNQMYSPIIHDPAGTGNDVAKKWTYSDFCKFMDETYSSWYIAYNALNSSDLKDSVEKWRGLLGDNFPSNM